MEYRFPTVFQSGITMRPSSFNFEDYHRFSYVKPSRVMEIHSFDQWKAYFDASIQNNKLMVIEFTAMWCRPCKLMEQTMEEFAAQYTDVDFIKIDADKLVFLARLFEVDAMPCFALVKNGMEVDRVVGVRKDELQNKIEKHRISPLWY